MKQPIKTNGQEETEAERKFADLIEEHLSKFPESEQARMVKAGTDVVTSRADALCKPQKSKSH